MLGTNDLKTHFHLPPSDIAAGAGVLARLILTSESGPDNRPPQLLLLCPPLIGDLTHLPETAARIHDGPARSAQLPRYYEALATTLRCPYLNTQPLLTPSSLDAVHLDAPQHQTLAQALATKVKDVL